MLTNLRGDNQRRRRTKTNSIEHSSYDDLRTDYEQQTTILLGKGKHLERRNQEPFSAGKSLQIDEKNCSK